jgi:hypothetical protein
MAFNPLALLGRLLDVVNLGARVVEIATARTRRVPTAAQRARERAATAAIERHSWTRAAPNEPPPRCIWCGQPQATATAKCPGVPV